MKTPFPPCAWLLTALLCLPLLAIQAQEIVEPAPVPLEAPGPLAEMQFLETTYDFGLVDEGTKVIHVYTFTNTSDEVLVLQDAKGSCGCTVPQWPKGPIAPGETASLTVEFNSKNKQGKRNQKVTITANTSPPQTFLYLTGEVLRSEEEAEDVFTFVPLTEEQVKAANPSCFIIYPNPTAELLILDMKDNVGLAASISIYAKTGQLMAHREVPDVEGTIEFQVGHYPPGTYIANVAVAGKQAESRCFVVMGN
jgi:hypothetical protein